MNIDITPEEAKLIIDMLSGESEDPIVQKLLGKLVWTTNELDESKIAEKYQEWKPKASTTNKPE